MDTTEQLSVEEHFLQAAEHGDVRAQINLGIYYVLNGEQELASKWLETASAQGSQGTTNSKDSQDNQSSQDRLAAQYMSLSFDDGFFIKTCI